MLGDRDSQSSRMLAITSSLDICTKCKHLLLSALKQSSTSTLQFPTFLSGFFSWDCSLFLESPRTLPKFSAP